MQPMILLHIAVTVPALAIGALVLFRRKGTASHKALGRAWVVLMAIAALSSFGIQEISDGQGYSPIHLLSLWTLLSLAAGIYCIRTARLRTHRGFMIGTYLGLLAAGALALAPGRTLGDLVFGA